MEIWELKDEKMQQIWRRIDKILLCLTKAEGECHSCSEDEFCLKIFMAIDKIGKKERKKCLN